MRRSLARLMTLVLLAVPLAACETQVADGRLPEMRFAHMAPINLDVASVEVQSKYRAPLAYPHVEHQFPTPPEKALKNWAADRLKAVGRQNTARLTIHEASVVETKLPVDKGFTGFFKKEQAERYEAKLEATIEIVDSRGVNLGFVEARVSRGRTLGEEVSLNQRDKFFYELTEALMKDMSAELEKNLRTHLGTWAR